MGISTGEIVGQTNYSLRATSSGESGSVPQPVREPATREESDSTVFQILDRPMEASMDGSRHSQIAQEQKMVGS